MSSSNISGIKLALNFSNLNRGELQNVLEYFDDDTNLLKMEIAEFLLENIPYCYKEDKMIDSQKL